MAKLIGQNPAPARDLKYEFFGTTIEPRTFAQWITQISCVLASGRRGWLCGHHNLHSLRTLQNSSDVRQFYARCDDCYIDGTWVRLILRGFGVTTAANERFSLMDHFLELLHHAQQNNWSVFYLGSHASTADRGRVLIQQMFPRLHIQLQPGHDRNDASLIQAINTFRPDILLVGWVSQRRSFGC